MRSKPRRRREVSPALITALAPVLRYSVVREAYVLRAIGSKRGPVLKPKPGGRFSRGEEASRGRFDREHVS